MSKETNEEYETEEKKQEQAASTPPPKEQEAEDSIFQAPANIGASTSSISSLSGNISPDGQKLDPITEAIRKEILQKQRNILREYFIDNKIKPDLIEPSVKLEDDKKLTEEELAAEEEKDKKFRAFLSNPNNQELINKAFEDSKTKKKLEAAEIAGYRNVHEAYSAANGYQGGFKPVQWENQIGADDLRATIVKNDAGEELCTLNETTVKTKPFTVTKQNGEKVEISTYREIDFPITLDKADGSMHLSMVALKADGTKPSKDKAVYFTAHYEEGPNGKPVLKEISSPQPLKFAGDGPDAVAYIEHGEEIYTLAVTRGKYQEMMKEVKLNKGQSIDLSQSQAEDLIIRQKQSKALETNEPTITPNQGLQSSIETPTVAQTTQMRQPQQAESLDAPNSILNVNTDLQNKVDKTGLIKNVADTILQDKEAGFEAKQAGINALTENTINNKDLAPEAKVAGVGSILESIKNNNALSDLEKSKMLEGTVTIALNSENLDPKQKQQILEKAVDSGLGLNDANARANTIDGITDAVIKSNLSTEDKGTMLIAVGDKVNGSELSNAEKQKLLGSILKKGVEAGILSEEQQQLIRQNLDKIAAEQEKENKIAEIKRVLTNPAFSTEAKTEAIKTATTEVLDGPAKAEIKGGIVEGITKTVAESSLDAKDKADIAKGVGEAIATHSNTSLSDKALIIESAERGVASSTANLEDKKLMTTGLVDGIYEGKVAPEVTSKLTEAVSSGIDKSTATLEDKQVLKDAASGAALERVTQNLNKGLQEQNIANPQRDLYAAAKDVTDALGGVAIKALDVSKRAAEKKANNIRAMFSPNGGDLKTAEYKRKESEQQINKSVADYKTIDDKYKPLHEQQQGSYDNTKELEEKKLFVKDLKLDDREKIKLISTLIQNEADNKKKGTVNNIKMLTENRTKLEEQVATQDKSKIGYDAQLKPKSTGGRTP